MKASRNSLLSASYFDGTSARARPVTLQVEGDHLLVNGEGFHRDVPLRKVRWPERTRHGMRVAHFTDGGSVQCADAEAWDDWSRSSGRRDSLVVTMQQSWRWVAASALALVVLLAALQQWGLPVAARAVVAVTPLSVDNMLGETSLAAIDEHLMRPSRLSAAEQARLREAFAKAVSAMPPGSVPSWQLVFRRSRIGPNAFALPGGTMVMTDELVELVGRDDKVVTAVLAHELGHVRHRHGLRMLVQVTALGGLAAMVVGDFSTVLAGVPVLLGQASYSRDAEREADQEAVRILKAAGISPAVMVTLFERIAAQKDEETKKNDKPGASGSTGNTANTASTSTPGEAAENAKPDGKLPDQDSWLGIAFASHPTDAERVRFFMDAAAER
ncbi:M48 family metallopeptidase [Polaromonas aquatica]|uniref:M48 family metallopeptidase n=1 Tax=Polaromonas aquatica TaxID=332657 RepID=UPI003D65FC69